MLRIVVPETEYYDSEKNEFFYAKEEVVELEHSLVALSKWEMKWEKPFLSDQELTQEESDDYIRCMILNDVDDSVFERLTFDNRRAINNYIDSKATATTITEMGPQSSKKKIVTSELIYSWMIALHIPFECQYWHLNRLMMLIRVCNIQQNPPKKMGRKEVISQNKALNQARRQKLNSKG